MAAPNRKLPTLTPQEIERFNSRIQKGNPNECWLWLRGKDANGYGEFPARNTIHGAHRIAYFLHYNVDPTGMFVCHNCPNGDNPSCVNPNHLFLGTAKDNNADCAKKGRAAKGLKSGKYTHPERTARGERHGSKTKPERCPRGERHGMTTLTDADVLLIRQMYKNKITQTEIAKQFNITQASVSYIVLGKSWKHLL